ncbi:site-specific integrase [Aeromonas caviae]|uniref:site-specific integrase n=1 Tax=Aeromonas caviae TaxID=648 RepID=UPI0029D5CC60|nr:site-specific integrase [Aeromonas caviae]MDX7872076.1 site-specific integrase [Aeromonas caviae]
MKTFKFTKAAIDALPPAPAGKQVDYCDAVVQGLRLRVGATGLKSFCVAKKNEGRFIRATLGRYPALTIDMARAKALETLGEVIMTGQNPNVVRREQVKLGITLGEALDAYITSRGNRIKAETAKNYRADLANYTGDWMSTPLLQLSREMVEVRHKAITEGLPSAWHGAALTSRKRGTGQGSEAQADRWARTLRAVWNFAREHYRDADDRLMLPESPTGILSSKRLWHKTIRRSSRIRDHELKRWLDAVDQVRQRALDGRDDTAAAICDALDMALFTGLRRSEVFELTWDRVNLLGGYFWIDTTKNGDPLELPITDTLLTIFRRRQNEDHKQSRFVFPGRSPDRPIQEPRRVIARICAATVPDPNPNNLQPLAFSCHDARRTFGSVAELAKVGSYVLKRLMNHRTMRSADVTQGYIHFSADELRKPAAHIEREILEAAGRLNSQQNANSNLLTIFATLPEEEQRRLLLSHYAHHDQGID